MIFSDAYLIFLFFQVSFHSLPGCPSHLSISLFASFRVSLAPSLTNFLLCLLLPLAWSHWFILLPSLLPCHVTLFILLPSQLPTRLHFFIRSYCSSSFHLFFLPSSTSLLCHNVHPSSISSSYQLPLLYQVILFILLPSLFPSLIHFFIRSYCSFSFHLSFLPASTSLSCHTVHLSPVSSSFPPPLLYHVALLISFHLSFLPSSTSLSCHTLNPSPISSSYSPPLHYHVTQVPLSSISSSVFSYLSLNFPYLLFYDRLPNILSFLPINLLCLLSPHMSPFSLSASSFCQYFSLFSHCLSLFLLYILAFLSFLTLPLSAHTRRILNLMQLAWEIMQKYFKYKNKTYY